MQIPRPTISPLSLPLSASECRFQGRRLVLPRSGSSHGFALISQSFTVSFRGFITSEDTNWRNNGFGHINCGGETTVLPQRALISFQVLASFQRKELWMLALKKVQA